MKLSIFRHKNAALTAFEVMVVIVCILMLAALLLPILASAKRRAGRLNCVNNLKQINIGFRIWSGENSNLYPMSVSVTNGGAMELIRAGNLAGAFQAASNEIFTPKLLVCPSDTSRAFVTHWNHLGGHISYFLSPDAKEDHPDTVLDGDDNLIVGGMPVKPGMLVLFSNTPVSWSATRHVNIGNIGMADGGVHMVNSSDLQRAFREQPTNRIVIP